MSSYGEFFQGLIGDPRGVSAPTPSGPELSACMAAQVDPALPGLVVELGPGTGVVTQALIERGVAPERLVAIESSAYFCDLLASRFTLSKILQGDAFDFQSYLPSGSAIAAVVSGVPLLNFPQPQRQALIARALDAQGPQGRFVQLSYGWHPPIPAGPGQQLTKNIVWRNLPPAHVWTYRRASH